MYAGLLYDYGDPVKGYSYEFNNIEAGLADCQSRGMIELRRFHIDAMRQVNGREASNKWLEDQIRNRTFDILFYVAFNESHDIPAPLLLLCREFGIKTVQWDCDSSWRFHNWILPRKSLFDYFVTTHSQAVAWYEQNGMRVIHSQWGGSPYYSPGTGEKKYDVTFIGQKHGIRPQIISALRQRGIKVDLFGNYWDGYDDWHGYLTDFGSVLEVFRSSKVCLNLSNPWHIGTMPQIKGRHFEIPQCGAFQISTPADNLHSYFEPNKEIVIANDIEELASKLAYYVANDGERETIAKAGYERMQREHQWHHRFEKILNVVNQ
jgi:spore maturation protein CgeB